MTRDKPLKLNAQISEEAAEWFIEFRTGDIDASGRLAFDAWVRSSPEHLRAYLEVAAIWNESPALDAERTLDIETLTARGRTGDNIVPLEVRGLETPDALASETASFPGASPSRRFARAAFVALLGVAVSALLWFQFYRAPLYATEVGEQRSFRLADGSTVELNSRSRLRVQFTDGERTVALLEGQALFTVAKNPARPFVVRSDGTLVRAVGTQFDVYKKHSGTIVTVVEGKVAILTDAARPVSGTIEPGTIKQPEPEPVPMPGLPSDGNRSRSDIAELHSAILLCAGEQLTVTSQAAPQPARVNVTAATAWTQRQLVLESAPLAEVAEEFNRYSARRLVVEDTAAHELRLSGVFATDPDFLIRYLRQRTDITVRETDDQIRIIRHD